MMKCSGKKLVVISVVKTGDKNKYGSNRNNFKMDVTTLWIAFKKTYAFQSIRLAWQLCAQKALNFSKHIGIIYKVLLDDNLAGLDINWSLYFSTSFVWAQGCKEKEIIPLMLHFSKSLQILTLGGSKLALVRLLQISSRSNHCFSDAQISVRQAIIERTPSAFFGSVRQLVIQLVSNTCIVYKSVTNCHRNGCSSAPLFTTDCPLPQCTTYCVLFIPITLEIIFLFYWLLMVKLSAITFHLYLFFVLSIWLKTVNF